MVSRSIKTDHQVFRVPAAKFYTEFFKPNAKSHTKSRANAQT